MKTNEETFPNKTKVPIKTIISCRVVYTEAQYSMMKHVEP